jgi:hypothetical protein
MEEECATRFSVVIEGDGRGLLADTKTNQDKPRKTKTNQNKPKRRRTQRERWIILSCHSLPRPKTEEALSIDLKRANSSRAAAQGPQ